MGLERVVRGPGEAESPLAEPGCPPRALLRSPSLRPCSPPGSMAVSITPFQYFVFKGLRLQTPLCVRVRLCTSCRAAPAVFSLLCLVCGLPLCEAPGVALRPFVVRTWSFLFLLGVRGVVSRPLRPTPTCRGSGHRGSAPLLSSPGRGGGPPGGDRVGGAVGG